MCSFSAYLMYKMKILRDRCEVDQGNHRLVLVSGSFIGLHQRQYLMILRSGCVEKFVNMDHRISNRSLGHKISCNCDAIFVCFQCF